MSDDDISKIDLERFGHRIWSQRIELGLSIDEVAAALQMPPSVLAELEAGYLGTDRLGGFTRPALATYAYLVGRFYGVRSRDQEPAV